MLAAGTTGRAAGLLLFCVGGNGVTPDLNLSNLSVRHFLMPI
jgi:hypothetical protein